MSFCCTVGYKWATVMDCVKFEFNDIISLYEYKKNDSERRRFINLDFLNFYYSVIKLN